MRSRVVDHDGCRGEDDDGVLKPCSHFPIRKVMVREDYGEGGTRGEARHSIKCGTRERSK